MKRKFEVEREIEREREAAFNKAANSFGLSILMQSVRKQEEEKAAISKEKSKKQGPVNHNTGLSGSGFLLLLVTTAFDFCQFGVFLALLCHRRKSK
nr:hypothetical protein [uncultured Prevotella sp.]